MALLFKNGSSSPLEVQLSSNSAKTQTPAAICTLIFDVQRNGWNGDCKQVAMLLVQKQPLQELSIENNYNTTTAAERIGPLTNNHGER